jgi:DNA-binding TFAR19-related protein (PDSD5 family)
MDLNQIREEKLKELQTKQEEERQILELENNAKTFLDNEALLRYGNLKSAFPEKSLQVIMVINQLVQQNHINKKLNDTEFKEILKTLSQKREIKITRK